MVLGRWLRRAVGLLPLAVGLGALVALGLAAVVDHGPGGSPRPTAFHLALAALDPYVLEAARNSLVLATVVAILSGRIGVWLARLAHASGRGRPLVFGLAVASMGVPPLATALGLQGLRARLGSLGLLAASGAADSVLDWVVLAWSQLGWGVPLVALAASRALDGIAPGWIEAARLAGGGRRTRWRGLIRPLVRPHSARAAGGVFALSLMEPGAPLVLGLRRTLPWQLVQAAVEPGSSSRAAVLALLAVGLALLGRAVCRRWGGDLRGTHPAVEPTPPRRSARTGIALLAGLVTLAWAALMLVPVAGLLDLAVAARPRTDVGLRAKALAMVGLLPWTPLVVSLAIGALVAGLGMPLALFAVAPDDRAGGILPRGTRWLRGLPPLAPAVGVLLGARLLAGSGGVVGGIGHLLDPRAVPGLLLVLVQLFLHWPALLDAVAEARAGVGRGPIEMARTLGASRSRAWWTIGRPRLVPPLVGSTVRVACLAGLDTAAALVLAPDSRSQPIGPAVLDQLGQPGGSGPAALLALVAVAVGFLSLLTVARLGTDALVARPLR